MNYMVKNTSGGKAKISKISRKGSPKAVIVSVSKDFTKVPRGKEGLESGSEFRYKVLLPKLEKVKARGTLYIDLDGTVGYSSAFLEGAFRGIKKNLGSNPFIRKRVRIISNDEPALKEEVLRYINTPSTETK